MPVPCPSQCAQHSDRRAQIVLKEKGEKSTYRALNPRKRLVTVIVVDGCCMVETTACDYLMLADDEDAYLIELKGSDVLKAIRQIDATLDHLGEHLRPRALHARIVPTRVSAPDILTVHEIKLKKRLGKTGTYLKKARVLEETI